MQKEKDKGSTGNPPDEHTSRRFHHDLLHTIEDSILETLPGLRPWWQFAKRWRLFTIFVAGLAVWVGHHWASVACEKQKGDIISAYSTTNSELVGQNKVLDRDRGDAIRERDKYEQQLAYWQSLPSNYVDAVSNLALYAAMSPANETRIVGLLLNISNMLAQKDAESPSFDLAVNGVVVPQGDQVTEIRLAENRRVGLSIKNRGKRSATGVRAVVRMDIPERDFVPTPEDGWVSLGFDKPAEDGMVHIQNSNRVAKAVVCQTSVAYEAAFLASFAISTNAVSDSVSASISVVADNSYRQDFRVLFWLQDTAATSVTR